MGKNWDGIQPTKMELNKPYSKAEASRVEGVSRPTIDKMIKDGRLEIILVDGKRRVVRSKQYEIFNGEEDK